MGSAELARPGETGGHSMPTPTPVRPARHRPVGVPAPPQPPRTPKLSREQKAACPAPPREASPACPLTRALLQPRPPPGPSGPDAPVLQHRRHRPVLPPAPPALPCPPCRCPLRGPPGSLPGAHQAALFGCPGRILTLSSWGSRPRGCPWQAGGALSVFGVSGHPTCLSGSQAGLQRMPAASPGEAAGSLGGEDRGQRWRRPGPGPVVLLLA